MGFTRINYCEIQAQMWLNLRIQKHPEDSEGGDRSNSISSRKEKREIVI